MATHKGFERKHFFINRSFQGRYMLTFIVPMLLMLAFMLLILYFASRSIINTTAVMVKEDVENTIASALLDKQNPGTDVYQALIVNIKSQLRAFVTNDRYRQAVIRQLMIVLGAGILVVIAEISMLTVFFSHKVAGPVYRLEKLCNGVIGGNYTETVRLRRGDDLQTLAKLVDEMIRITRGRMVALRDATTEQEKADALKDLNL